MILSQLGLPGQKLKYDIWSKNGRQCTLTFARYIYVNKSNNKKCLSSIIELV